MDFTLLSDEQNWQSIAHDFSQHAVAPRAHEMDESGEMHMDLIEQMAALGLLGAAIPKSYGGSGMSHLALALVYEELGRACSSVRGFMTVHSSLVMQCINTWGDEKQKQEWLPKLSAGQSIGCYALTEPEAGSDAASIQTSATPSEGGFHLNGEKIWITNAMHAHVAIVFAKLPEDLSSVKKPHERITAFLVPTDSKGFEREPMPGESLGHRASDHAHLHFTNCFVPWTHVLGGEGMGFKVAMSALDHGRLGVAAGALGVHQACMDASLDFVRKRRQFGQRIADFEMVQSALAEMKMTLEASRNLVYRAAWTKDQGMNSTLETSIAKLHATEAALKAASDAVLLHGGRGYSNEFPVERYYRDIKGLQIYEGTSFIQKIVIARLIVGKEE
jgi:alkylation response protein AidB-like acyl-CoA dehydrogenase